ncbi:MAG: PEP-CTERM sorting domain-containing protein [Acidobacteria bacterium]|nr:PEP-CTERM sorting domain-containing protein [Acidobacteriota bacterium]
MVTVQYSSRPTIVVGGLLILLGTATAAGAEPIQLNFAAVSQSPWAAAKAFVLDKTLQIPDPHFSGHVDPTIETSPIDALLDILGISLDIGSLKIHPSATFDAGLTAHYHVNGGELNVNYPRDLELNLPDRIPADPFTISASFATGVTPPRQFPIATVTSVAGAGYGLFVGSPMMASQFAFRPAAGFTTTFPFAEARLDVNVDASASINLEGCILTCFDLGSVDLPSVHHDQEILEVSTLKGLYVMGQPVFEFGEPLSLNGWAELTVHALDLSVTGDLQPDRTLAGSDSQPVFDFGFNVEQLIPFIGQFLHREFAGFGYELLKLEPHATLGVYQRFSFEPSVQVALEFSEPVIFDGRATNQVSFGVGESITVSPTTSYSTQMSIKPTFYLENTFHNETGVFINGSMLVEALKLEDPVELGPAFRTNLDLFTLTLPPLFNESFSVNVPPITTDTLTLARDIDFGGLLTMHHVFDDEDTGESVYDVDIAGLYAGRAVGFERMVSRLDRPDHPEQQSVLDVDDGFVVTNPSHPLYGMSLGDLCVVCSDISSYFLPTNPALTDNVGTLFFSNLSTFTPPQTAEDVLALDRVLAEPNFYQQTFTTAGAVNVVSAEPVPEPGTLILLGSGVALAAARARLLLRKVRS